MVVICFLYLDLQKWVREFFKVFVISSSLSWNYLVQKQKGLIGKNQIVATEAIIKCILLLFCFSFFVIIALKRLYECLIHPFLLTSWHLFSVYCAGGSLRW